MSGLEPAPLVVITGASTGIGLASAKACIAAGFDVWVSVRQEAQKQPLLTVLGPKARVQILDVRDSAALAAWGEEIKAALGRRYLAGLINNAGIAINGPIMAQDPKEIADLMAINFHAAINFSQILAPVLGLDGDRAGSKGTIVMMSSVSGQFVYPFSGGYSASKHALEAASTAMRRELSPFGINVVIVAPGAVATPIWDKGQKAIDGKYATGAFGPIMAKFAPLLADMDSNGLSPETIGTLVANILKAKKPKWRYAPVKKPFSQWFLLRYMPVWLMDFLVRNWLKANKD